jgi:hypothetical protein
MQCQRGEWEEKFKENLYHHFALYSLYFYVLHVLFICNFRESAYWYVCANTLWPDPLSVYIFPNFVILINDFFFHLYCVVDVIDQNSEKQSCSEIVQYQNIYWFMLSKYIIHWMIQDVNSMLSFSLLSSALYRKEYIYLRHYSIIWYIAIV